MDIPKFLDLALELETLISKIYTTIAELSGDPPIAKQLKTLAGEEINHANAIRRGREFYEEVPNLFAGITMDETELAMGLEEARIFHASLTQGKVPLLDGLKKLLSLETRFERIHIGASVKFTDSSMKNLFENLTKSDQVHVLVLKGLIESFGEGV
jgi:rubrerythrin